VIKVFISSHREPRGLGHVIINEPFAVFFEDDIVQAETPCLKQMMALYERLEQSIVGV
jgi:UTP--glucose-1-phosphate uridylyltransferase